MEKKYEILKNTKVRFFGREIYRIKALKDFSDVKKGDIGGYVESEYNLSQEGDCWIYDNAVACDNAVVRDNSIVHDNVMVKNCAVVRDNTIICGNAEIKNHAVVKNYALVCGNSIVCDHATACDHAVISSHAKIDNHAKIKDKSQWFVVENVGSRNDNITFYETDNVIYANVGCFSGTLDEFIKQVKITHKGNKFEKEYLQMTEIAKVKLGGLNE